MLGVLRMFFDAVSWFAFQGWPSVALRHIDIETFFLGSSLQTTLSIVGVVPKAMSGYWYVRKE